MIPDLDIFRSAQALVKQHGADAPIQAAMCADELLEAGDLDGCAVWKRVVKEVEQFQREESGLSIAPWRSCSRPVT